jgi:hypothetical protein
MLHLHHQSAGALRRYLPTLLAPMVVLSIAQAPAGQVIGVNDQSPSRQGREHSARIYVGNSVVIVPVWNGNGDPVWRRYNAAIDSVPEGAVKAWLPNLCTPSGLQYNCTVTNANIDEFERLIGRLNATTRVYTQGGVDAKVEAIESSLRSAVNSHNQDTEALLQVIRGLEQRVKKLEGGH